jgi:hypothetical protein
VPAPLITPQGGCAETPAQAKRKASQLEDEMEEWLAGDEQEEEIVRAPRKKTTAPQTKKGRGGEK